MPAPHGNKSGLKWAVEHDDALKALRLAGYSSSQIANEVCSRFGIDKSRNAVIGRLHRLGLTNEGERWKPRVTKERTNKPRRSPLPRLNPEEVILRCVEIVPRGLSLMELEPRDCRFPYGDGPFTFCGHPAKECSSYCVPHFHFSIGPGTPSERATA